MKPPKLLHVIGLSGIGGMEQKFRFYLKESSGRGRAEHHLLLRGRPPHTQLREDIYAHAASVQLDRYRLGLKLPRRPKSLRLSNFARAVRRVHPDAVVIWNRFGEHELIHAVTSASQAPVVHCECGGAWHETSAQNGEAYLADVSAMWCASNACRRFLELRWGWKGKPTLVLNCLRPDCRPRTVEPKTLSSEGRIKLGMAARTVPAKGICLAVHALKSLRDSGYDAELLVAGGGISKEKSKLQRLVRQRELTGHVTLHGTISDMPGFYGNIDILLSPSIREPFGSVCLEASAFGCVVVAGRVDGLTEAVEGGVTGLCLAPTLPIAEYPKFGGTLRGLPELVYDPASDKLVQLSFVSPEAIATAVAQLIESPGTYERMSSAALSRVESSFLFSDYVDGLDELFAATAAGA